MGTVPTLSQIQAWDTEHLTAAADHWSDTADRWENAFTDMWQQAHTVSWEGVGATAMRDRVSADKTTVAGQADQLRQAAGIARQGASDISAAQHKVLYAVEDATNAGFRVDDDLSVIDKRISRNAAQRVARQAQAQSFAADIRQRAGELSALDTEVGANITSAAGGIRTAPFGKSGDGQIEAIDNTVRPHDDPFNEHIDPPPYKAPDGKEWHWYTGGKGWQLENPLKQCDGITEYRDITGAIVGIILAPLSIPGAIGGVLAGPGAVLDLTHCQPPGGTH